MDKLKFVELSETMTAIHLGNQPLFMVYYDPTDKHLNLTMYDGDHVDGASIITESKYKVRKGGNDPGLSIRRYQKCV